MDVLVIQVWRITNDLVTQVRDLAGKVTHLEEEKEKYVADTEKLVRATSMSQLEHIKTLQASIEACNVRLYAANRVLQTRDQENRMLTVELTLQREEHLETLIQLQDVQSDLASYKSYVAELKGELLVEKESQHIFREILRKHESEGHHEVHPVDEIETLLEELRSIAAEGGENSALYKRKQKLLENVLRLRHEESLRHNPPAPTGGGTT